MKKEMKHFKGENAGRSMTEMLGVLAIIGVLSVGGITGYKLAMNHYAANQIAYEINMLRTDAKVKIAQGATELTFDEPYHSGHFRYDSEYKFDGYCFSEGDETSENCANASGYEFKLSEIPGSICPILEKLFINMGGKTEINPTSEGEESSECQEEGNTIYVAFEAERFGITGGGEEEGKEKEPCNPETCEGECTESGCVPCEEMNKHWNGNSCVSCTNGEWIGNQCICPAEKPYWDEATETCKSCSSIGDGSKPYWDSSSKTCKTCYEVYGREKPQWDSGTKQCVPCEGETKWNPRTNMCADGGECESNADCGAGKYCYLQHGYYCNQEFDSSKGFGIGDGSSKGECHKVSDDLPESRRIELQNSAGENITYYGSNVRMTWWSACRLCAAKAGGDESDCVSGTTAEPSFMAGWGDPDFKCAGMTNLSARSYCKSDSSKDYGSSNVSETIVALRKMYDDTSYFLWLKNNYSSCNAYNVNLNNGYVNNNSRYNSDYALCRDPD